MMFCNSLKPNFSRYSEAEITGTRTNYQKTLFPSTVQPGEQLSVVLPALKPGVCLVPNSVNIVFNLNIDGKKSTFNNNLSKVLVKRLTVKYGGVEIYDNNNESLFGCYDDLWLSQTERLQLRQFGVMSKDLRKKVSGDDSYETNADIDALFKITGKTLRIPLGKVIGDHGLMTPCAIRESLEFVIQLTSNEEVLTTQADNDMGSYSLTNLKLEYGTIENTNLADESIDLFAGYRTLMFEHVQAGTTETWSAKDTIRNVRVNSTRKSLRSLVCLFTKKTRSGSEEYVYPNIQSVNVTVDGVPGAIYNHGIQKDKLYHEAKRVFGDTSTVGVNELEFFLKNKFALVIDLRTTCEKFKVGSGKHMSKKKESEVAVEIQKTATTEDVTCHTFLISDGVAEFEGGDLTQVYV